jgi:hypothetical protein
LLEAAETAKFTEVRESIAAFGSSFRLSGLLSITTDLVAVESFKPLASAET